jgi:putative ABC transport system substrate-binding protein
MLGIRRREFITLLGGAATWPVAARAQQGERVRRLGALMTFAASDPEAQLRIAALEAGLRDLGWVQGRNLHIDYRWAPGQANELLSQAAELVASSPDLILANATPATIALREQTRTLPIVFAQVNDPVGQGFVSSLAHPGGNLTGFTTFEFSIGTKWLETLKVVFPAVKRVAVIFNPATAPYAGLFWQPIEAAAPSFSVEPIQAPTHDAGEIEQTLGRFARDPNGGLLVLPDVSTTSHRDLIIALAARHRLPAIYPFRYFADSGGMISYGTDTGDLYRRLADYIDRVLRGAKPGDLPVQLPIKYELVINLKATRALGLTVPSTLLALADQVIE